MAELPGDRGRHGVVVGHALEGVGLVGVGPIRQPGGEERVPPARSPFVIVAYATSRMTSDVNANSASPSGTSISSRSASVRSKRWSGANRGLASAYAAAGAPLEPTTAQSSSSARESSSSASRRAATSPWRVTGTPPRRGSRAGRRLPRGTRAARRELLHEERVAAAALVQRPGESGVDVVAEQRRGEVAHRRAVERFHPDHREVAPGRVDQACGRHRGARSPPR